MKKNKLLLAAGFSMLLTGCMGTKYTYEDGMTAAGVTIQLKYELTVKTSTFSLKTDTTNTMVGTAAALTLGGDVTNTMTEKHTGNLEAVENKENVYKLTTTKIVVSDYVCEGTGATAYNTLAKESLKAMSYLTSEDITNIIEGKKVTIELEEKDYITSYVKVNPENHTFAPTVVL